MQEDTGHLRALNMQKPRDIEMAQRNPDLVFRVGEKVKVKGGAFRVKSFGKKMMVLEGLPGTRLRR